MEVAREPAELMAGESLPVVERPVRDSFLVFGAPLIDEDDIETVAETLRSGWIGTGPKVQALEDKFKEYTGAEHAVAVSSCTAGLHLALETLRLAPGDEVLTSPMTFVATANAIIHAGGIPVFADVDPLTLNIDPVQVERQITPRTRAIIPVHMAGRACAMDALIEIGSRHHLPIVGDAAHAIEASYRGASVATIGDAAVFSFYVTKNLTTIEGGMVTTSHPDLADEIRTRSMHGLSSDAWKRYSADGLSSYEAIYPGYKYNLTDVQAALGLRQLERIDQRLLVRERHWHAYWHGLEGLPLILPPADDETTSRHARHLFVVMLDLEMLELTRDEFVMAMRRENIGCGVHFIPVHLHRYYRETYGYAAGSFPCAEYVGERVVSLPLSAKLTPSDVADVVRAVRKILSRTTRRRSTV